MHLLIVHFEKKKSPYRSIIVQIVIQGNPLIDDLKGAKNLSIITKLHYTQMHRESTKRFQRYLNSMKYKFLG